MNSGPIEIPRAFGVGNNPNDRDLGGGGNTSPGSGLRRLGELDSGFDMDPSPPPKSVGVGDAACGVISLDDRRFALVALVGDSGIAVSTEIVIKVLRALKLLKDSR